MKLRLIQLTFLVIGAISGSYLYNYAEEALHFNWHLSSQYTAGRMDQIGSFADVGATGTTLGLSIICAASLLGIAWLEVVDIKSMRKRKQNNF